VGDRQSARPLLQAATSERISGLPNGTITEATWRARINERRAHQILSRSLPDGGGHLRVRCPASNPHPMVRCELKPKSDG
jgi:hypothetical protein